MRTSLLTATRDIFSTRKRVHFGASRRRDLAWGLGRHRFNCPMEVGNLEDRLLMVHDLGIFQLDPKRRLTSIQSDPARGPRLGPGLQRFPQRDQHRRGAQLHVPVARRTLAAADDIFTQGSKDIDPIAE